MLTINRKLEKYHATFEININDSESVSSAYQRARYYGESMIDFKFAKKYFIVGTDTEIHCIPTTDTKKHLADYYDK